MLEKNLFEITLREKEGWKEFIDRYKERIIRIYYCIGEQFINNNSLLPWKYN